MTERCAICHCSLTRAKGKYAGLTVEGRSHRSKHHFVAERFFGRSANRRGTKRPPIFHRCPWMLEGVSEYFCYECHELLLHNPVLTREDVSAFSQLVRSHRLSERTKPKHNRRIAGRIKLMHKVIRAGLNALQGNRGAVSQRVRTD